MQGKHAVKSKKACHEILGLLCACKCVSRVGLCVCVCVCERERERERGNSHGKQSNLAALPTCEMVFVNFGRNIAQP